MSANDGQAEHGVDPKPLCAFLACLLTAVVAYGLFSFHSSIRSSKPVEAASKPEAAVAIREKPLLRVEAETLLRGTIEVRPGYFYQVKFTVPPDAVDPKISGSFQAHGGSGNDIRVVVGSTRDFENWINGHTAHIAYSSRKLTTDELRVPVKAGREYVVALDNTYTTFSSKSVETSIYLVYQVAVRSNRETLGERWNDGGSQ